MFNKLKNVVAMLKTTIKWRWTIIAYFSDFKNSL